MNRIGDALADDLDGGFPKLVEATRDRVFALARSLTRSAHDADDVAQDAYVRAYRALRTYSPARLRALQVRPWLAAITLNVWRNTVRGRRRDTSELDARRPADEREAPHERAERSDAARELRAHLAVLPERYRLALVLRHAYDMPYAEAARVLRVPVGTLKANVHRGARLLRAAYERGERIG